MKFIIYKSTGGLAHNLNGLKAAINIAQKTKRILIIDSKNYAAFGVNFGDIFEIKNSGVTYYDNYDIIPRHMKYKGKTIDEFKNETPRYTSKFYILFNDNVSKDISESNKNDDIFVYVGTGAGISNNILNNISVNNRRIRRERNINNYNIVVKKEIEERLNTEEIIDEPYVAVHFRNTDIKNDINVYINKIKDLNNKTKIKIVYLASDYNKAYDIMVENLPDMKIIRKTIPPDNIHNLHYVKGDKYEMMYESLRDIYYILKSNYFIPSINSGFSRMIINMVKTNKYMIPNVRSKFKVI